MTSTAEAPQGAHHQLLVSGSVERALPSMVRTELARLPAGDQEAFVEEFRRKTRGAFGAYLCSLLYCHYAYLGRWGTTLFMWLIAVVTFGVGGLIWWVIDLFRMPGMVRDYNRDVAMEVMRNFKAING